jgi:hypothetical protein
MINLIIDGNYVARRTMHICSEQTGGVFFTDEKDEAMFIQKVLLDLGSILQSFEYCERFIVVFDSPYSWRKQIPIEGGGYKSTRKKSDGIDWDRFFVVMDDLANLLQSNNIPVMKIDKAEGDDLLYLWASYLVGKGECAVVVTADKDLYQIVEYTDDAFSVVYGGSYVDRKIIAKEGFGEWLKRKPVADLLDSSTFMGVSGRDVINDVIRRGASLVEIDPVRFCFDKILVGDRGDAVPAVLQWPAKTNPTKRWSVTEKKTEVLWEQMCGQGLPITPEDLFNDATIRNEVARNLIDVCKPNGKYDASDIGENIIRNIKLMYLSEFTIPEPILNKFYEQANTIAPARRNSIDMEKVVKGTRFEKDLNDYGNVVKDFNLDDKLDALITRTDTGTSAMNEPVSKKSDPDPFDFGFDLDV